MRFQVWRVNSRGPQPTSVRVPTKVRFAFGNVKKCGGYNDPGLCSFFFDDVLLEVPSWPGFLVGILEVTSRPAVAACPVGGKTRNTLCNKAVPDFVVSVGVGPVVGTAANGGFSPLPGRCFPTGVHRTILEHRP